MHVTQSKFTQTPFFFQTGWRAPGAPVLDILQFFDRPLSKNTCIKTVRHLFFKISSLYLLYMQFVHLYKYSIILFSLRKLFLAESTICVCMSSRNFQSFEFTGLQPFPLRHSGVMRRRGGGRSSSIQEALFSLPVYVLCHTTQITIVPEEDDSISFLQTLILLIFIAVF